MSGVGDAGERIGARILIVEDHPTMREAMRMVLEHEGFAIREAADGAAALELVREHHPDLVFLDLNIPGTSGAEVLRELKENPQTADVRVIIVTATGEEGRDQVLRLGADEYFTKPFSPLALLHTVERVLEGGDQPHGAATRGLDGSAKEP
jgi:two-component system, OmpR family, phosphate regulon response regulator PhoB